MKKSTYRAIMLTMTLFLFQTAAAAQTMLPGIQGWSAGELRETKFESVSGNHGTWLERDYRTAAGVPFHAVWIDGSGPKGWNTGKKEIAADDGAIGSGAHYKTITQMKKKPPWACFTVSRWNLPSVTVWQCMPSLRPAWLTGLFH